MGGVEIEDPTSRWAHPILSFSQSSSNQNHQEMDRANDEKAALFDKEIYFTACDTIYVCSNCYCILPQSRLNGDGLFLMLYLLNWFW
jgi:hypothetical protein